MTKDELKAWCKEHVEKYRKEHEKFCKDDKVGFDDTVRAEVKLNQAEIFLEQVLKLDNSAERKLAEHRKFLENILIKYGDGELNEPAYSIRAAYRNTLNNLNAQEK